MGNRSNYSQWMFMFFFQMSISYQVNIGTILSISSLYYSQFNIPQSYGGFDPSQNPLGHPSAKLATAWDLMSLAQPAVSRFLSARKEI